MGLPTSLRNLIVMGCRDFTPERFGRALALVPNLEQTTFMPWSAGLVDPALFAGHSRLQKAVLWRTAAEPALTWTRPVPAPAAP